MSEAGHMTTSVRGGGRQRVCAVCAAGLLVVGLGLIRAERAAATTSTRVTIGATIRPKLSIRLVEDRVVLCANTRWRVHFTDASGTECSIAGEPAMNASLLAGRAGPLTIVAE